MTQAIGVDVDCPFSPGMLKKVVHAGSQSASFVAATKDLIALAETHVSRERVERWTKRVGNDRVAQLASLSDSYQALPLPQRRESPVDQVPHVACVQMDGGRIQIRERHVFSADSEQESTGHWRETLVGCLLSMMSKTHHEDPCPIIPKTFVDPQRMHDLSREIKGFSASSETAEGPPETSPDDHPEKPKILVRSVVATRQGIESFGTRLIAAAYRRGFSAASRKAFVADGAATNWNVHRKHFSHYTPILDFTHAIYYVWATSTAGRLLDVAWTDYTEWAQLLWSGQVTRLITLIQARHQQLPPPHDGDETAPAAIVARAIGYLTNQRTRMKYAQYRKEGLPITSSHIESTIKQINRRVKGTEKFWDRGAEPILQLAADHISETNDFDDYWRQRHQSLQSIRCYRTAA